MKISSKLFSDQQLNLLSKQMEDIQSIQSKISSGKNIVFASDDPVGAVSVHGVCGIWGTLAVGIWGGANFATQLIGTLSVSIAAFAFAFIVFGIIKAVMGVRVSPEEEAEGLDLSEHGQAAYPDFAQS